MSETDAVVNLKARLVRAVRTATGMHEHLAVPIADDILQCLCEEYGASEVYIPSSKKLKTHVRNRDIRESFNGANHAELAKKYGITERQVRRILCQEKK
ncbi:MAG TPA: hypothetical protein ENI94_12910 [Gammaproteobacteria bacterium]|nr:hypothetical protein [Gammaproteobacteria bacterium]